MSTAFDELDVRTASQWISSGQATLVDVREPAEFAAGHIPQARLLPLSKLDSASPPGKAGGCIIVHCKSGSRSAQACRKWAQAHPDIKLYMLQGGIDAWRQAGLPIASSSIKPFIDIQRQLQIVIGLGVLSGVVLGVIVSPWLLIVSVIFGTGLTLAGITGRCPLAMVIARLPWNQRYENTASTTPAVTMGASCCALPAAKSPAAATATGAPTACQLPPR